MAGILTAIAAALALTGVGQEWSELAATAVAALAAAYVLSGGWPRAWGVGAVVAAPGALGWAQWAWLGSEDSAATEVRLLKWFAVGLWALAISRLFEAHPPARFLDCLLAGGCLVAAASAALAWWAPERAGWPLVNRNHFAAFCVLLIPLAASAGRRGINSWRLGAGAALALCGLLSGSRAGFVLVVAELLLLAFLLAPRRRAGTSPRRVRLAGAALAAAALVWGLGQYGPPGREPRAPWLLYRDQIWAAGWELFWEKPWSGHGLGSFRAVYPARARFDTGEVVHRAHNDWLEWLVEGGALAPLPMAALGGWALLRLRHSPWLAGVPLVLLHSVVDYPLDRFLLLLLLVTLLAAAAAGQRPASPGQRHLDARKKLRSAPITELESFAETALQ